MEHFRNIEELLDVLPDDQRRLTEVLRKLIFECIPDAKEKLSYNVPFYSRHTRIVFIWPGAMPWGPAPKEGVALGFCRGNELADPSYLETGGRKQVFTKTFHTVKDIDAEAVRMLLYEAQVVDEEAMLRKKKKR
ncbi:MAG TPA: DUF1801 domain-containing protein [Chitinophagaceae bacterium]|nr:DUF1801 domain-containing protein [Chitinophagaceae bacterium]